MTPAAEALARQFAQLFMALSELGRTEPAEAALIGQHIAAHLRSSLPQSFLLDTGPVPKT